MARRSSSSSSGSQEETAINLTSMLDVIFNILSFFVMTYAPFDKDQNFDISLPPPKVELEDKQAATELPTVEESLFDQFNITLRAGGDGSLATISIQPNITGKDPRNPTQLTRVLVDTMKTYTGGGNKGLDGANIFAPPSLKYRVLIEVVDACYRARVTKINFLESSPKSAAPSGGE